MKHLLVFLGHHEVLRYGCNFVKNMRISCALFVHCQRHWNASAAGLCVPRVMRLLPSSGSLQEGAIEFRSGCVGAYHLVFYGERFRLF